MSGIIGHLAYALLAARAAERRRLGVCRVIDRHLGAYVCGAYLGCDIQTMPEAVCVETGQEVGYGTVPLDRSPLTGGPVRPYHFHFDGTAYRPDDIHRLFYGRSHLAFGWSNEERRLAVDWERIPDYLACVLADCRDLFDESSLAYAFGWATHVAGDSLIKSIRPGINLRLVDGQYTPANRPIQDAYTFHEVVRAELGLDWERLLQAVAQTPVLDVQAHYMRVSEPRGKLAERFPDGWRPEQRALLAAVLAENRRYLAIYNRVLLKELERVKAAGSMAATPAATPDLGCRTYAGMVELAEAAGFRRTLDQIGQIIAGLFAEITHGVE